LPIADHEEDSFFIFLKTRAEFLGKRLVSPISLLAVALRELGREGDDAGERHYVELV
jgi:hypothetical protein